MISRAISPSLLELAGSFPVVTILVPRQSGKTTLTKAIFPGHSYVNLEELTARKIAQEDYQAFFELYPPLVF